MNRLWIGLAFLALALVAGNSWADAIRSAGYTVRYSAINSLQIPSAVAETNGIARAGDKAIITITLQHPTEDDAYHAVPARVTGQARTLIGERHTLDFRRIESDGSVYSIAALPLAEAKQTVTLTLEVTTLDGSVLIPVTFTKKLYTRQR